MRTKVKFASESQMATFAQLLNAAVLHKPSHTFSASFEEPFLCKSIVNEQSGKTVAWGISWINCINIDEPQPDTRKQFNQSPGPESLSNQGVGLDHEPHAILDKGAAIAKLLYVIRDRCRRRARYRKFAKSNADAGG